MSSLFHRRLGQCLVGVPLLSVAWAAGAAQYTWSPKVEATTEFNTNRDLVQTNADSSAAYFLDFGGQLKIATPRSVTTLRPVIRAQQYPDQDALNSFEGMLDFYTQTQFQRGRFDVFGQYEHRDAYNADLADPHFNDINPGPPPPGTDSGKVNNRGVTREKLYLAPQVVHEMTERLDMGLSASYQKIDYSNGLLSSNVPYDYLRGTASAGYDVTQRTSLVTSLFAADYSANEIGLKANGHGLSFGFEQHSTQLLTTKLSVTVEKWDVNQKLLSAAFSGDSTTVGGTLDVRYKGEVSTTQLLVSRSVAPSTRGGVFNVDEVQLQLDRALSERLQLRAAGLYYRENVLQSANPLPGQDYFNGEIALRWAVARDWYVSGGGRYTWIKGEFDAKSADNEAVFLSVAFQRADK
jgi:hypothetical protein